MKVYRYFLAYEVVGESGGIGKGTVEVGLRNRIRRKKEVEEVEEKILKDLKESNENLKDREDLRIMIYNFILMDEDEVEINE